MAICIQPPALGQSTACETILRSLPEWFGIEESLVAYVREIETMPTLLATDGDGAVGFLTVRRHNRFSAEIHVMAVSSGLHRKGIGKGLLSHAESWLVSEGTEYLQVKTLGPSRSNAAYEKTRGFYIAFGFRPLEEFDSLWGQGLPCLQLVKRLAPGHDQMLARLQTILP